MSVVFRCMQRARSLDSSRTFLPEEDVKNICCCCNAVVAPPGGPLKKVRLNDTSDAKWEQFCRFLQWNKWKNSFSFSRRPVSMDGEGMSRTGGEVFVFSPMGLLDYRMFLFSILNFEINFNPFYSVTALKSPELSPSANATRRPRNRSVHFAGNAGGFPLKIFIFCTALSFFLFQMPIKTSNWHPVKALTMPKDTNLQTRYQVHLFRDLLWSIAWLIDKSMESFDKIVPWLIDWLTVWLIDRSSDCQVVGLIHWLIDWLIDWLAKSVVKMSHFIFFYFLEQFPRSTGENCSNADFFTTTWTSPAKKHTVAVEAPGPGGDAIQEVVDDAHKPPDAALNLASYLSPLYINNRTLRADDAGNLYSPSSSASDLASHLESTRPQFKEDDGLYVGQRPTVTKANQLSMENRATAEKALHWIDSDWQLKALADPVNLLGSRCQVGSFMTYIVIDWLIDWLALFRWTMNATSPAVWPPSPILCWRIWM